MPSLLQYERKIAVARNGLPEDQWLRYPTAEQLDDKWLEFGNHCNKDCVPFIVYADLECVLRKTKPDREDASSYMYQQHEYRILCALLIRWHVILISIAMKIVTWFAQQLQDLAHRVKNIVSANVPITPRKHCRNSNGRYTVTRRGVTFARNRSRRTRRGSVIIAISGRYRDPTHSNCNLNYKNSLYIPIVFHNLSATHTL